MTNPNLEYFYRTLEEKHRRTQGAVKTLIDTFLSPAPEAKRVTATKNALDALDGLTQILLSDSKPGWVDALKRRLTQIQRTNSSDDSTNAAFEISTQIYSQVLEHNWRSEELKLAFDFDGLFEHCKQTNRIPELFDRIVLYLQEILDSGVIDSVSAIKDLERVIQTLKASRNGSYVATWYSWNFAKSFIKKTLWEAGGDVPIIGAPIRALRGTLDEFDAKAFEEAIAETDSALEQTNREMIDQIRKQLGSDIPMLDFRDSQSQVGEILDAEVVESRDS